MYNAKENNVSDMFSNNKLKYDCICERMYFEINQNSSMVNVKKSLIPIENILED
ncbi:hypothetical protein CLTEP_01430 [Clostridium tepidiprofundi DSM 19306]|uniref:Uncharacterized protein n=1 Tax=Clostridium tepidiprofundi DSM 19306 TaxID=1121338 RepID=A0A151B7I4_9CLOT|nr:hypothetical protein [Clostridium tepidiprofundi]KYH35750.1 hypothetical protein CLTEP_01430 [Clostridium tepidiprofundi DSM 19306]